MKVVGIFGVSGVGKTTLIFEMVRQEPTWQRASAGSLVRQYLPDVERDSLRMLSRDKILDNQEAIVRGVTTLRTTCSAEVILLDGHVLVDSGQELIEIPLDVIGRLALDVMLFIYDAPDRIARRRQSDPNRNRAKRSEEDIGQEQSHARTISERYARELGIPFATAMPAQCDYVTSIVKEWLRS